MIACRVFHGGSPAVRETRIIDAIAESGVAALPSPISAVILENYGVLPIANGDWARASNVRVVRIAPSCICCTGNLVFRVTLNRLLQGLPDQLFISLAENRHLDEARQFLTSAPYLQRFACTFVAC